MPHGAVKRHSREERPTAIDLRPTERARVYPFGAVWHWKCGPDSWPCAGGRSRTLPGAYDCAVAHLAAEHGPRLALTLDSMPRYTRWYVTVKSARECHLGYIEQPAGRGFRAHAWIIDDECMREITLPWAPTRDGALDLLLGIHGLISVRGHKVPPEDGRVRAIMDGRAGGARPGVNKMGTL